uniref:SAM domain-containing protein n=1 Tax=Macrostomum lignano TaxID=282301 RepID=A0A1I8FKT8_9PLAT
LLMSGIRQIQYAVPAVPRAAAAPAPKGSVYRATWKSEKQTGGGEKKLLELDQTEARAPVNQDLKSKNVVLTADFSVCKLCDFGAARVVLGSSGVTLAGTPAWMAVEMLRRRPVGGSCTRWSRKAKRLPVPPQCPTGLSLLLEKCWSEDPDQAADLRQHCEPAGEAGRPGHPGSAGQFRPAARGLARLGWTRPWRGMRHTRREALRASAGCWTACRWRSELAGNLRLLRPQRRQPRGLAGRRPLPLAGGRLGGCGDLAQYARRRRGRARFMALTGPDLLAMGVKSYGHRKDLLEAKQGAAAEDQAMLRGTTPGWGASVEASLVSVGGAAESPGSPQCRRRSTVALSLSVHRLLRPGRVLPGARANYCWTPRACPGRLGQLGRAAVVPGGRTSSSSPCSSVWQLDLVRPHAAAPSPDGSACAFVMPDWIASPAPAAGAPSIRVEFRPRLVAKPSHCSLPLPGLWVKHWGGIEKLVQLSLADCPAASPAVSNGYYHEEASLSGISLLSEQQRLHPALEAGAPPHLRPDRPARTASTSDPVQSPTDSWISAKLSSTASSSNALAAAAAAAAAAGCVAVFRRSTPATIRWRRRRLLAGRRRRQFSCARPLGEKIRAPGRQRRPNGASRLHPHGRYRRAPARPRPPSASRGGRGGGSAAWGASR